MTKISSIETSRAGPQQGVSGSGMDRIVEKRPNWGRRAGYGLAGLVALAFVWWLVGILTGGRTLSVDAQRIIVSDVTVGTYEDFIPLRGRLVPSSTVYLDAIEGGRVERVLVEDGAIVEAGTPIVLLSNTNLQLEVLSREAAVTEQLNNMRTIELQLEQNRLSHRRNLVEIDYQITRLTRSVERQKDLASRELVSQMTIEDLEDELAYYRNRREVTIESQATDARLQAEQLRQLREAGAQLKPVWRWRAGIWTTSTCVHRWPVSSRVSTARSVSPSLAAGGWARSTTPIISS